MAICLPETGVSHYTRNLVDDEEEESEEEEAGLLEKASRTKIHEDDDSIISYPTINAKRRSSCCRIFLSCVGKIILLVLFLLIGYSLSKWEELTGRHFVEDLESKIPEDVKEKLPDSVTKFVDKVAHANSNSISTLNNDLGEWDENMKLPRRVISVIGFEPSSSIFVSDALSSALGGIHYREGEAAYEGPSWNDVEIQQISLPQISADTNERQGSCKEEPNFLAPAIYPAECISHGKQQNKMAVPQSCYAAGIVEFYSYPPRYFLNINLHMKWYQTRGVDVRTIIITRDSKALEKQCNNERLAKMEENLGFNLIRNALSEGDGASHRVMIVSYDMLQQLGFSYWKVLYDFLGIESDYVPTTSFEDDHDDDGDDDDDDANADGDDNIVDELLEDDDVTETLAPSSQSSVVSITDEPFLSSVPSPSSSMYPSSSPSTTPTTSVYPSLSPSQTISVSPSLPPSASSTTSVFPSSSPSIPSTTSVSLSLSTPPTTSVSSSSSPSPTTSVFPSLPPFASSITSVFQSQSPSTPSTRSVFPSSSPSIPSTTSVSPSQSPSASSTTSVFPSSSPSTPPTTSVSPSLSPSSPLNTSVSPSSSPSMISRRRTVGQN